MSYILHTTTRSQTTQAISAADGFQRASPPPTQFIAQPRYVVPGRVKRPERLGQLDFKKEKELDRELIYLQDPVKLAENTIALLREDDNQKALELTRRASKQLPCTVSWNHLVDYEMSKGRIKKAVTIYNEMKKRAQRPDAQTYTILLRGLSWHPHMQDSLPLALKIYHSMFAENCPVKPNIIHTNAVLKVCALARDMDALWGVTAKLPPRGPGAPNNLTFTTILNAVRVVAWQSDKDLGDEDWEEKSLRRQRAVIQGRRIWEEILPRWRAGDLLIDEELVCTMGRLLLLGSTERDYDDILSLAEQVMGIPRQKRRLGDPLEISDGETPSPVNLDAVDADQPFTDQAPQDESSQLERYEDRSESHGEDDSAFTSDSVPVLNAALANVFRPSPRSSMTRPGQSCPGRNTLSLILDACVNLRAIPSAQAYWGLLTDPSGPYNVVPDSENYHMYLRVLRVQRSSHGASELIKDMFSGDLQSMQLLQPKTFRIAFSACVRNKASPRMIEGATQILNIMYKSLVQPDLKSLDMFREIASTQLQQDFRITLNALRGLETGVRLVRNYINFGIMDGSVDKTTRLEATGFANRILGLYDKVSYAAGDRLERDEKNYIIAQKSALRLWVQRQKNHLDRNTMRREIREGARPRPEGMKVVRKTTPVTARDSRGGDASKVKARAGKGLGVGWRKRERRAGEVRERSEDFDGFEYGKSR
ncbi:MAG: hypothetical protein Q9169_004799 [Polycauliona sp. 2 TL-2023]